MKAIAYLAVTIEGENEAALNTVASKTIDALNAVTGCSDAEEQDREVEDEE